MDTRDQDESKRPRDDKTAVVEREERDGMHPPDQSRDNGYEQGPSDETMIAGFQAFGESGSQRPPINAVWAQRERRRMLERSLSEANDGYTALEASILEEEEENKPLMKELGMMSLVGHLNELRKRIVIAALAFAVGFAIAYYYVDPLMAIIVKPAGKLYYMRPTEAFFTYMKVAGVFGFLGAFPIIFYELWAFLVPAMTKGEKRISNWLIPAAIFLFFCGVAFAYFLVLPAAVHFFIGFSTNELQPLFSIGEYINFIIALTLPFGVIFELPLFVMGLALINIATSQRLKKIRKYFVLLAFIIGAAVSPTPDIFSQCMMALPMIILYEVSIQLVARFMKK